MGNRQIDVHIDYGWVKIEQMPMTLDSKGRPQISGCYVTRFSESEGYGSEYVPPAVKIVYEDTPRWKFWVE